MRMHNADENCGIAQAAVVMADWWNVLVLREVARGHVRFDALAAELGLSRKVLTERLGGLVALGVLRRSLYQRRPTRYEYLLTESGTALLPVLVALQEWGDRWALGDGSANTVPHGPERARLEALVGTRIPDLCLTEVGGAAVPVVDPEARATVLFAAPGPERALQGASQEGALDDAATLTAQFRAAWPRFEKASIAVRGVSLEAPHERPECTRTGNEGERVQGGSLRGGSVRDGSVRGNPPLPYPLLSDEAHHLTAALRLPTFRNRGRLHLKQVILITTPERTIHKVLLPPSEVPAAPDLSAAVEHALHAALACNEPTA